ncbi:MAG: hypothetical protein JWO53_451, partial [Chlamydiia bacterium]|nr:hypothetical protein [Chlamydiia bacterium]
YKFTEQEYVTQLDKIKFKALNQECLKRIPLLNRKDLSTVFDIVTKKYSYDVDGMLTTSALASFKSRDHDDSLDQLSTEDLVQLAKNLPPATVDSPAFDALLIVYNEFMKLQRLQMIQDPDLMLSALEYFSDIKKDIIPLLLFIKDQFFFDKTKEKFTFTKVTGSQLFSLYLRQVVELDGKIKKSVLATSLVNLSVLTWSPV